MKTLIANEDLLGFFEFICMVRVLLRKGGMVNIPEFLNSLGFFEETRAHACSDIPCGDW